MDLRQPRTIDAVILNEYKQSKIQKFTLEYKKGIEWIKISEGQTIGDELTVKFKKLTTQFVRLNILASDTPTGLVEVDVKEAE